MILTDGLRILKHRKSRGPFVAGDILRDPSREHGFRMSSSRPRCYVGLGASLHDPAIAILGPDGSPRFVEAGERFLQNKRAYQSPPDLLLRAPALLDAWCDRDAEIVAAVSWSGSMLNALTMSGAAPGSFGRPDTTFAWPMPDPEMMLIGFRNALAQAGLNLRGRRPLTLRRYDHHLTHAAAGAFTSPFADADVAVLDGYGEGRSTSFFRHAGATLTAIPGQAADSPAAVRQFVSLGHFYARLCGLCGFDPILGEEWKVMGLAAYGTVDPDLYDLMRPLVAVRGLGIDAGLSDADAGSRLSRLRCHARPPGAPAESAANLAATGQRVFEDTVMDLLQALYAAAPNDRLVLAGGCALNSSCNGKIVERTPFRELHVPSAPADDGCALGAACLAFAEDHPGASLPESVASAYLGSAVDRRTLDHFLRFGGMPSAVLEPRALIDRVVDLLADGAIVGWMQGQAEFGPRALGHRSILADPRRPEMKDRLNALVKFREEFRPFAPAILDECGPEFFETYQVSRYMERTLRFRADKAALVPAVVHADGTGRLQSVRREWTPLFHDLIAAFALRTGVPVLLNTSLNVMGKPIVHSLEDALGVFLTSGLDALVVDDVLVIKDRR